MVAKRDHAKSMRTRSSRTLAKDRICFVCRDKKRKQNRNSRKMKEVTRSKIAKTMITRLEYRIGIEATLPLLCLFHHPLAMESRVFLLLPNRNFSNLGLPWLCILNWSWWALGGFKYFSSLPVELAAGNSSRLVDLGWSWLMKYANGSITKPVVIQPNDLMPWELPFRPESKPPSQLRSGKFKEQI